MNHELMLGRDDRHTIGDCKCGWQMASDGHDESSKALIRWRFDQHVWQMTS